LVEIRPVYDSLDGFKIQIQLAKEEYLLQSQQGLLIVIAVAVFTL